MTKPTIGVHIWEGPESSISKICAMINEGRRFVDGLVEIGKLFIGHKMTRKLLLEVNCAINQYIDAWFREYDHPGWKSICRFDNMSSSITPEFETSYGEIITANEAQYRIDKYGWRLGIFEEERARRFQCL